MRERIPSREERLTSAIVTELKPALLDLLKHTEETALQLYTAVGLRLSPAVFIEVATKLWASQKEMWAAVCKHAVGGTAHSWCYVVCGAVATIDRVGLTHDGPWEANWEAHAVLSLWKSRPYGVSLEAVIIATMMPSEDYGNGRRIADELDLKVAEGRILDLVSSGAASVDEQAQFMETLAQQQAALAHADEPEGYDAMPGHEPGEFLTTVAQHLSTLACAAPASVPVVVELVSGLAAEAEEAALNNEYEDEYGHYHREPADHSPVILLINDWSEAMWKTASRPEASAQSPSSTPRQRQIERRAASSLGQPRLVGRDLPAGRPHWPRPPHRSKAVDFPTPYPYPYPYP
tara:strand:- start:152 stop:1195 length:1044 start_codon:yes stop_codon:yes gene_type:complete